MADNGKPTGQESKTEAPQAARLKEIGGFELIEKIGQGGMGAVFKARQKSLDRVVALKVLPPSIAKNSAFIERFQREARASAKFSHPNIVQGIDVGKDPATGLWYFAMEYVDGPSLKQVLAEQKTLPEKRALGLAREVALALECIAGNGMVHRDIKPDNILLTKRGEAKLADLGLAKQTHDDASITQSGLSVGTPHYMAPEQVRGQLGEIDIRTDIYALGGTLFHLVTGQTPYTGETGAVIMSQHLTQPPPKARAVNPQVSESCSRLIEWLMQKQKEQRIQTPAELLKQLDRALAGQPIFAPFSKATTTGPREPVTVSGTESTRRTEPVPARRSSLPLGVGAVAVLVVGILAYFALAGKRGQDAALEVGKKAGAVGAAPAGQTKGGEPQAAPKSDSYAQKKAAPKKDLPAKTALKKATPQELLRAAQEWEKTHPEAYDEILAQYQKVAQAAKAMPPDLQLSDLLDDAREAVEARRAAAVATAWKALEEKAVQAAAAGDYDAAIAACEALPPPLSKLLEERAAARAKAFHQEAEERIKAAVARIEECSANAEPAEGQKLWAEAAKITYAPTKGIIETLQARLKDELANEGEIKQKRALRIAEKRLDELLQRFDKAVLETGDRQAAKDVAAEAQRDAALAPLAAQARALGELTAASDELSAMSREALARLKGQKIELLTKGGVVSGTVDKVQDENVYLRIGSAGVEAVKLFRLADLNEEQRRLLSGAVTPQSNAQRTALALTKLAKGKENLTAAAGLLAGAGDFALAPHYGALIEKLRQEAAQAQAEAKAAAAWAELEFRNAAPKLSEAQAKTLMERVLAFEADFGRTQFAATVKERFAAVKERLAKSSALNAVRNGDFETGELAPWTLAAERDAMQVEITAAGGHESKCAARIACSRKGGLSQVLSVEPGAACKFSMWVKVIKGNSAVGRANVYLYEGERYLPLAADVLSGLAPDVWKQVTGTIVPANAKATLLVHVRAPLSLEFLMDDVQLVRQAQAAPAAAAPQAASLPPASVPEGLKALGLVFWVSPHGDPAGTCRDLVSNTPGRNRGAMIGAEGDRKILEFQKGYIDYEASAGVAGVTTPGSVFVWIRTDDLAQWGGVISRGEGPRDDFSLWVDNGRFALWCNYPLTAPRRAGEGRGYFYSKSALPPGKWTFCGAVWDGKTVTVYINGVRDNVYPYVGHPLARCRTVTVGANPAGSVTEYYIGALASAMIFNRALSEAEIKDLYANPGVKAK